MKVCEAGKNKTFRVNVEDVKNAKCTEIMRHRAV